MRYRYSIRMFAGMGDLALSRGDLATARSHSAQCLELATRTGSRKNLVKAWRLAGRLAQADGEMDAAEGHLRKSLDIATSIGNPVQHWKADIALGRFLDDVKRPDEARHAFARAFALMQRVREGLRDDRLRVALDRNPDLQLIQSLVT
jgi:tetratricopeptide (TPR) repeat protein